MVLSEQQISLSSPYLRKVSNFLLFMMLLAIDLFRNSLSSWSYPLFLVSWLFFIINVYLIVSNYFNLLMWWIARVNFSCISFAYLGCVVCNSLKIDGFDLLTFSSKVLHLCSWKIMSVVYFLIMSLSGFSIRIMLASRMN